MNPTGPLSDHDGSLHLAGRCRAGDHTLEVELVVPTGTTLAVVGPNGAGKTTLLRTIAGLTPLQTGTLTVNGTVWDDPAAGVWVRPERRSVGLVFQDLALFPHLTALANVAFGLRARGVARADAHRSARTWLERVGLADRAGARPRELSGGQAQRVALARSLATEPQVTLLDEPLSGLDAASHAAVRDLLATHPGTPGGVRLLVTHDPADAFTLGDRIAVIEDGRLTQLAAPDALRPVGYLARFLG